MSNQNTKEAGERTQRTPGPWIHTGTAKNADGSVTEDVAAEHKGGLMFVAECATMADARLIAAAPELLAELKSALPTIEDAEQDERLAGRTEIARIFKRQSQRIRAAIARAEKEA